MKKIAISIILIASMIVLLACSANNSSDKSVNNSSDKSVKNASIESTQKDTKEEIKKEIKKVEIGSTIKSNMGEVKINKIEFSFDVVPDKKDGLYEHYPADLGKVFISIDADVKNLQKQNLSCDNVMDVEANYNDGYKYNGFPVVKDTSTGFTYANITQISPLETKGMKFLIDCPKEVAETKNPLVLTFKFDGEEYSYTMR